MSVPHIISVREQPEYARTAINYLQSKWPDVLPIMYEDCITHCLGASAPLPLWYLLMTGENVIGCAGLIPNDFISRMDLYPWICALHIEDEYRGHAYGSLLLKRGRQDAARFGFANVYLSTEHIGLYEKYGFTYLGQGYHPWGDESRIYECPAAQP